MKNLRLFLLSIAAGVCIGFGGLINLTCIANELKVLGGILFSVGLFLICVFGFKLFTGQVGYFFEKENKFEFFEQLGIFYIGNLIGAVGFGYLLRLTGLLDNTALNTAAEMVAEHKLVDLGNGVGQTWYSMLILAFFCGALVFLAVDGFNNAKLHPFVRTLVLFFCVSVFVVCGFEHCIADMFYLGFAGTFTTIAFPNALVSIFLGSTGNILGAFATYFVVKIAK